MVKYFVGFYSEFHSPVCVEFKIFDFNGSNRVLLALYIMYYDGCTEKDKNHNGKKSHTSGVERARGVIFENA